MCQSYSSFYPLLRVLRDSLWFAGEAGLLLCLLRDHSGGAEAAVDPVLSVWLSEQEETFLLPDANATQCGRLQDSSEPISGHGGVLQEAPRQ